MAKSDPDENSDLQNGDFCEVVRGKHAGKSGVVQDINLSKGGNVTITVVEKDGRRFKTLARNVVRRVRDV